MCGILLNIGSETITPEHPALNIIAHRGPDGFGAISFDTDKFKIGLGHRRLSIIDLSESGHQPMSYDGGKFWIVFNGEIYNYREIRKELELEGFSFQSSSDTEVLLASYKRWGIKCLDKFNGMFSFCIYDKKDASIFIVRDRFGVKPLYFYNSPKCFRVGSEIKQFLSIEDFVPKINTTKLYHFLNSGDFSFDNETLWKGVNELEPGHFININLHKWKLGDELKPQKWYEAPFFEEKTKISFDDAVCEFRKLLEDSVRLRLRSDVPVGFLLSGGLDSSTLVGLGHLACKDRTEHLKTYSSCYEDSQIDERPFIYEMLHFVGAEHLLHFPKPEDIKENLDHVIWNNDIPVLQGSPVVHWLLYQRIKAENDSRKVIIEGQGGDEILCGYGDFHWALLNEKMRSSPFSFISQIKNMRSVQNEPWSMITRKLMRINFPSLARRQPNSLLNFNTFRVTENSEQKLVSREGYNVSELHRKRFSILRFILHNVDRNSMAHSREARTPFLDYRLVEFCLRLPSEMKISNGYTKLVLRKLAEGIIPPKITSRTDKQGYSSPLKKWVDGELRHFFVKNLREASKLPFIKGDKILAIANRAELESKLFDPVLWRIITTNRWMELFKIKE